MSEEEEETVEVQEAPVAPRERLNWKAKAQRVYESRQVAREQTLKMMKAKAIDQFRESLTQLLGQEYEVEDLRTEIEGVTFIAINAMVPGAQIEIHAEFICKACGGVQHQNVRGLADIGAILAGAGEPHEDCPAIASKDKVAELTPAENLIEALRNFMASELEQVD